MEWDTRLVCHRCTVSDISRDGEVSACTFCEKVGLAARGGYWVHSIHAPCFEGRRPLALVAVRRGAPLAATWHLKEGRVSMPLALTLLVPGAVPSAPLHEVLSNPPPFSFWVSVSHPHVLRLGPHPALRPEKKRHLGRHSPQQASFQQEGLSLLRLTLLPMACGSVVARICAFSIALAGGMADKSVVLGVCTVYKSVVVVGGIADKSIVLTGGIGNNSTVVGGTPGPSAHLSFLHFHISCFSLLLWLLLLLGMTAWLPGWTLAPLVLPGWILPLRGFQGWTPPFLGLPDWMPGGTQLQSRQGQVH